MKNKILQDHIDFLISQGVSPQNPAILELQKKLKILDKIPQKDWDKESTKERIDSNE